MRGTATGLRAVEILPNILDLKGVSQDWQQVWRGCVLVGVVLLQLIAVPLTHIGGLPIRRQEPRAAGRRPTRRCRGRLSASLSAPCPATTA